MANKTSLIIKSVDQSNKETSRSITDVSKTATNQQLKDFAQALNATSTNTYKSSSRVQTTDLDTAQSKTNRQMNLVIIPGSGDDSLVTDGKAYQSSMSEGAFYGVSLQGYEDCYANYGQIETESAGVIIYGSDSSDSTGASFCITNPTYANRVVKFYAPETDIYLEAQAEITIVGGE